LAADRNLHQTITPSAPPPFNIVENLQSSFGLLYNNNVVTTLTNPLQSPQEMQQHQFVQQSPLAKIVKKF
jgi:hypothetical protein